MTRPAKVETIKNELRIIAVFILYFGAILYPAKTKNKEVANGLKMYSICSILKPEKIDPFTNEKYRTQCSGNVTRKAATIEPGRMAIQRNKLKENLFID